MATSGPVSEDDIPRLEDGPEFSIDAALPVIADGIPARVYIRDRAFASQKIVIVFDEPHPRFHDEFTTKYFILGTPGRLDWGHDGQSMPLTHRH